MSIVPVSNKVIQTCHLELMYQELRWAVVNVFILFTNSLTLRGACVIKLITAVIYGFP